MEHWTLRQFARDLRARGTPRTYVTLLRDIAAGKLPAERLGNIWAVPRDALYRYGPRARGRCRAVTIAGVTYPSVAAAAAALGVSRQTIYNRLRAAARADNK